MKKEHYYIIIGVALVAAYFLFFRKKESKVDAVLIPPASPRNPVVAIPSRDANDDRNAMAPEPMLVPQNTALLFNRPAPESRVVSGLTITNGGSSQSRVFGNRNDARKYYYNRGGAGACSFVELSGGQFEVACP
jgi:hypothetical protein